MNKIELIFIPSPGLSHLVSTLEAAKLLLDRDHRLSVTFLVMKLPKDTTVANYLEKFSSNNSNISPRLHFINLPQDEDSNPLSFLFHMDKQTPHIREIVSNIIKESPHDSKLGGLVLDMFCTNFIQLANEFNLPSYVFFTSGACSLGLINHLVSLRFEHNQDLTQYKDSDAELHVLCFSNPVPTSVLPGVLVDDNGPMSNVLMNYFQKLSEARGVMVNTFYELESYAIDSLLSDQRIPKVYPIGPILNNQKKETIDHDIQKWLDEQPQNSVVFLCFGTMGSFEEAQVKEIARALENSGTRFLWSLRRGGEKGGMEMQYPTEYENFEEVLPEGFLGRTEGVGKVTGWAAQVAVLSQPAVGGFVSHCGWNSTLESVWFGVPVAALPMYAEQQVNAFQLVKELGMAEAIRVDYKMDVKGEGTAEIVAAEEIEAAIRRLMAEEGGSGVREKVKEMQNKSRMALMEGGSSYEAQRRFIEDVITNIG